MVRSSKLGIWALWLWAQYYPYELSSGSWETRTAEAREERGQRLAYAVDGQQACGEARDELRGAEREERPERRRVEQGDNAVGAGGGV